MQTVQWKMTSKIGALHLTASPKGLTGVFFAKQKAPLLKTLAGPAPEVRILARAARELDAYFSGKLRKFTVPLDAAGTEFQKSVWSALSKIPYGRTCSYRDIARRIRNPKAVRAVGSANGRNPLCVIVPCHRVISNDGSIGGYSGGIQTKIRLLTHEGVS